MVDSESSQAEQQVTPKSPTIQPVKNMDRVGAGKALAEKTKQERKAQKKATQATVDAGLVPPLTSWIPCILDKRKWTWKSYLNFLLRNYGEAFLLSCNYDANNLNLNLAGFYAELLLWWADFRRSFFDMSRVENIIWNNCRFSSDITMFQNLKLPVLLRC